MPSKINVREAVIQQLSPALGSDEEVAVAALGLEVLAALCWSLRSWSPS